MSAHVRPNLYLSLLPPAQVFRVRKQAKPQLLSVSWESGFCWAAGRKRRSSTGADILRPENHENGNDMEIILAEGKMRAKSKALVKAWWGQVDLFKHWDFCWIRLPCVCCCNKNTGEWLALRGFRCCSWQHEDKRQCWNIFYVEGQGGFLSVREPRNHQDAAAGAATEGRCC